MILKSKKDLLIIWKLPKFRIPLSEIIEVTADNTSAVFEKADYPLNTPKDILDLI
ncbi:hypothetical protein [Bacillus cereus]|uniref:SunI/YnzG family protein n=1 Tax=Bacillus cereus TaxID=1396 RepID=UPI000657D769|nr:hypothetical protein [Bacillus cereus]KLA26205.1 hypothetical protein B4080_3712 [Bacillus cereus]